MTSKRVGLFKNTPNKLPNGKHLKEVRMPKKTDHSQAIFKRMKTACEKIDAGLRDVYAELNLLKDETHFWCSDNVPGDVVQKIIQRRTNDIERSFRELSAAVCILIKEEK
jgi:hypothetical protein